LTARAGAVGECVPYVQIDFTLCVYLSADSAANRIPYSAKSSRRASR
jgi:hypothetical protein